MPWIFGYGSLIWKADFNYSKKEFGFIKGFVRRFWHGSTDHRGTEEFPGRVVTLIPYDEWKSTFQSVDPHPADGVVWGAVYFIDDHEKDEIFQYLDYREKNGYKMLNMDVTLQDGKVIDCYIYIAPVHDADFLGPATPEEIARTIFKSIGPSGPNIDYLLNLCDALENIHPNPDYHLCELKRLVLTIHRPHFQNLNPNV